MRCGWLINFLSLASPLPKGKEKKRIKVTIQEIQCLIHRNFSKKKMTEKIRGKEIIKDKKRKKKKKTEIPSVQRDNWDFTMKGQEQVNKIEHMYQS